MLQTIKSPFYSVLVLLDLGFFSACVATSPGLALCCLPPEMPSNKANTAAGCSQSPRSAVDQRSYLIRDPILVPQPSVAVSNGLQCADASAQSCLSDAKLSNTATHSPCSVQHAQVTFRPARNSGTCSSTSCSMWLCSKELSRAWNYSFHNAPFLVIKSRVYRYFSKLWCKGLKWERRE